MRFKDLHPNIQIRVVTSFLTRFVSTMIFPFMAIYFSNKLGQAISGVLLIFNIFTSIIVSFYGGYLADVLGRKKLMVISQIIQVFAFLIMALANSVWFDSPWLTFWMMFIHSISIGLLNPAAEAMLIDVSTKENRKYMYSINYWAVNLSIGLGSLLGGFLFEEYLFELFIALTITATITLILVKFFMVESYISKKEFKVKPNFVIKDMIGSYKIVLKDKNFIIFSLAGLLVISLEFQTNNYIAVRLEQEFISKTISIFDLISFELDGIKMLSWIRVENTFLIVLATATMVRLLKNIKDTTVLYLGIGLYTIGFVFQGFSNDMIILFIAVLIATVGEMMYIPVKQSYLADIVNDEYRSSYMAINNLVFQGGKMVGALGLIIGAIFPSWFMAILYLFMGFTGLFLFYTVISRLHSKKSTTNSVI